MTKNGFPGLYNYTGDLIHDAHMQQLLAYLGLDISYKKLVPQSKAVVCLGILIETVNRSISIPLKNCKRLLT